MITAEEAVLQRWWVEIRADPRLTNLAALLPADRELGLLDALPLAAAAMVHLRSSVEQLQVLDALAHAYARAAGLRFVEG